MTFTFHFRLARAWINLSSSIVLFYRLYHRRTFLIVLPAEGEPKVKLYNIRGVLHFDPRGFGSSMSLRSAIRGLQRDSTRRRQASRRVEKRLNYSADRSMAKFRRLVALDVEAPS